MHEAPATGVCDAMLLLLPYPDRDPDLQAESRQVALQAPTKVHQREPKSTPECIQMRGMKAVDSSESNWISPWRLWTVEWTVETGRK